MWFYLKRAGITATVWEIGGDSQACVAGRRPFHKYILFENDGGVSVTDGFDHQSQTRTVSSLCSVLAVVDHSGGKLKEKKVLVWF